MKSSQETLHSIYQTYYTTNLTVRSGQIEKERVSAQVAKKESEKKGWGGRKGRTEREIEGGRERGRERDMEGGGKSLEMGQRKSSFTTSCSLELHLLHVDLAGCHADGDGVDDGRIL